MLVSLLRGLDGSKLVYHIVSAVLAVREN